MDFYDGRPYMIRRSRGYAPLPFMMTKPFKGSVIAYGGELKNTFCVAVNSLMYPSSYIGDLTDLKGKNALKESAERMLTLLETKPSYAVCDLHPSYNSSAAAEESGLKLIRVQHHYAHILSCMAENDHTDEVIGISLDGTGFGTDGTIWGGEILKCSLDGFERKGHIRPFLHTGGDVASREGFRIAISMLIDVFGDEAEAKCSELGLIRQGSFKTYTITGSIPPYPQAAEGFSMPRQQYSGSNMSRVLKARPQLLSSLRLWNMKGIEISNAWILLTAMWSLQTGSSDILQKKSLREVTQQNSHTPSTICLQKVLQRWLWQDLTV